MRVPFVGPAYRTRGIGQSAQRAVNCFLERTERGGRTEYTLYGTPGLTLRATVGDGPIRELFWFGNYAYIVSGDTVYRMASDYTTEELGTIGTSEGDIWMASNGTQILIVDGDSGYLVQVGDGTFTEIVDTDFPDGVTWCDYLDGYFIVGGDGSQRFYISDLNDGSIWVGTEFASAEGDPDSLTSGVVDHRELFLFGPNSFEIWSNTGNATFPIERTGNAFGEVGILAPKSLQKMDNSIFWLGADRRGGPMIWKLDGYQPIRISTHGVEHAIAQYETVSDARAYTYQYEGHTFYVLIFPTEDTTWMYDASTGEWNEWLAFSQGDFFRHRSNCHTYFSGKHLVGDYENGKVYSLEMDVYTDNGDTIKRLRATTADDADLNRVFYSSLQVDCETGVGLATGQGSAPLMMLRYSNDRGNTWSSELTSTMGAVGEYSARCIWHRLGSGRSRVWEISMTDPVKFVVYGAVVNAQAGAH